MRKFIVIVCSIIGLVIIFWGIVKFYAIYTKTSQSLSEIKKQTFKNANTKAKADPVSISDTAWDSILSGNVNLTAVFAPDANPHIIYTSSANAVLKSENAGQTWTTILLLTGCNKSVNFLLTDSRDNNSLYVGTENGLFYSSNQGESWKRIFRGKNYLENACIVLIVLPSGMYLGTKQGLFISKDNGLTWHKQTGKLANSHIFSIASDKKNEGYLYAACIHGVFRSKDSGQSWERIFIVQAIEKDSNDDEEVSEDQDEQEQTSKIRHIIIDPNIPNCLFLATSVGVYKSIDKGSTWDLLSNCGLVDREVKFLLISYDSVLYALTKSGIFRYTGQKWDVLPLGIESGEIHGFDSDREGNLYAACDKGLFKTSPKNEVQKKSSSDNNLITGYIENEPRIEELHKAAAKYAEVEPEKILRWRKQAAMCAWLPKLSIGIDRDKDKTISSSIWGTYGTTTTPGKYYAGPDDETRDNNKNWSISLSWELGDLIWNDSQTSIDARSRLMVQLRNDILDEVTKLYFERIRVKMELDSLTIEDRKKRFEKEMKLQELTAYLDGLTGNYFSRQINQKHSSRY